MFEPIDLDKYDVRVTVQNANNGPARRPTAEPGWELVDTQLFGQGRGYTGRTYVQLLWRRRLVAEQAYRGPGAPVGPGLTRGL